MAIEKFRGYYGFLSNMYECDIVIDGMHFTSAEAAFQSYKPADNKVRKLFVDISPKKAKTLGKSIDLRDDWDQIRDKVMFYVVREKFRQNPVLRNRLLKTGNEMLIEGNDWGDKYWGVCDGVGENKLGRILVHIRDKMK